MTVQCYWVSFARGQLQSYQNVLNIHDAVMPFKIETQFNLPPELFEGRKKTFPRNQSQMNRFVSVSVLYVILFFYNHFFSEERTLHPLYWDNNSHESDNKSQRF